MNINQQRGVAEYVTQWNGAKTPFARRVVAYTAAVMGDSMTADYLAGVLGDATAERIDRSLAMAMAG